ncbi:hypothetical protein Q604_UNBC15345G0001, partial [human gut metagenome]
DGLVYITRPYAEGEHWSVQEHDLIFLHAKGQRHLTLERLFSKPL